VVDALAHVGGAPVVLDPVMVSESGAVLLDEAAREALVERLLPLAAVATPNLPEARALAGRGGGLAGELAREVLALGPQAVVVTGGHSERNVDLFYDGREAVRSRASATRAALRTAPAAPIPLSSRLSGAWRQPPRGGQGGTADRLAAVGAGLRELGEGPGPVNVLGLDR